MSAPDVCPVCGDATGHMGNMPGECAGDPSCHHGGPDASECVPCLRSHVEDLEGAIPDAVTAIERLIFCLEEIHAEDVRRDHEGDGPHGCSYCEAVQDATEALEALRAAQVKA